MMDDIFVLKRIGEWRENGNRGTLKAQSSRMKQHTLYSDLLENTSDELSRLGLPTLSFEEHAPFICNRRKLLAILKEYGEKKIATLLWRSLYGNIHNIPTHQRLDVKVADRTTPLPRETIISTNEQSWAGATGIALREWFPVPSKYEK